MQNAFIHANSPDGQAYLSQIDKMLASAAPEQTEILLAFKEQFNAQGGCDPLDFLDFFPHGGIGVNGLQIKCDIS